MSKARDLADFISTGSILSDGTIESTEISGVTATAPEINVLDGITATTEELNNVAGVNSDVQTQLDGKQAIVSGVSDTEIGYLDGVTSNLQTQLDNISVTSGSLTKSFASGETASITLAQAISPAPVVSATKEVAQAGQSSKGAWDVNATASNYDLHNTAYDTTLTPSTTVGEIEGGTLTDTFYTQGFATNNINSFFNNDGTRLYVYGYTNSDISSFPLSTAYDISTRGSELQSVTFDSSFNQGFGPRWNNDGTKIYYPNLSGYIYELAVSTAYDLSTIAASSTSTLNLSSYTAGQLTGIVFKPDGTRLWAINDVSPLGIAIECTLSTAWDLSTASFTAQHTLDARSTAIAFADNGSTMYNLDRNADLIQRFNLSTAYDISTSTFAGSGTNLNLGSGVGDPCNITIDNDDKVLLVANYGNHNTYQYSASVTNSVTLGTGSFASTDVGKRIQGNGGDVTLTSAAGAYDTTGGSAFTDSSTIASGSWSMRGLKSAGDADGLKITGIPATNAVYASTFRVANYADVFDASSDLSTPIGLHMARDGSHLYACSQNGNLIVYSMSTSFLPSTASYQGSYNSVGLTSKWDVEFNETGTRMFVQDIVSSVESVKVFSLSVPWRPDTGTVTLLSTYNLGVSETDSTPTTGGSIQFSNNGRSFYYHPYASKSGNSSEGPSQKAGQSYSVPSNSGVVYYWTLSTAYDLSSKTYQGYKRVPHHSYPSFGVTEDGKWLINGAYNSRNVFYYAIQTAWDITSINSADEVYIDHGTYASSSSSAGQIASSWVGDNYYTIDYDNRLIQKFPWGPALTTAATPGYIPVGYQIATTNSGGQIDTEYWTDINSMTADQSLGDGEAYYAVSTDDRTTWSVAKGSDGVRPIVRDNSGTWQYNSNGGTLTGYDISSPTYTSKTLAINTYLTGPQSFTWGNNGAVLFVCGQSNDKVFGFNLSTAYDLSTATVQSASGFSVGGQSAVPRGVLFNENGTKLYVLSALSSVASGGSVENKIYEYSMSTAYDSTTLSYVATYDFTSHHTNAFDMTWNGDGTKFYTVEQNSNLAHTFSLTTAYDMSTASYVSGATRLLPTNVTGLHFNSDGTVLFFSQHSSVLQYNLTTAYDITTSSDSGTSWNGFTSQGDTAQAVIFNNDGTRLYILSSYTDSVYEYDTSFIGFDTNTTWTNSTTNDEFYALQQALGATEFNRMDKTQLDAVADGSHFTLGDSLDLMIALYMGSNGTSPTSDGVSINYDAQALNQGAVLGTDYDYDFPDSTTVRVTSNAAQNLKIRVV